MKKLLKCCFSVVLAVAVVFSFTACKKKMSKTTVNTDNVKQTNGVSTNGGITAVHGDYLYFINGTKTNDGKSAVKNKRSAICRVKYNVATGEVDKNTYEVVVDNLVGFANGSLEIFGDFLYFTTPSSEENYKGTVLNNKTSFMRYDLVNKKTYEIYTTKLNDSKEVISFEYYVTGDKLNLLVYETTNKTITSINIDDKITTNYVISNVTSCLLSETNGKCAGTEIDANAYVYYTMGHEYGEALQTGVKVFQTSPDQNNSKKISDAGKEVELLCIRNGKLIYSVGGKIIYYSKITGLGTTELAFNFDNILSYSSYENVVFVENADGSVSLLTYDTKTYALALFNWETSASIDFHFIKTLSKAEKFEFVGLYTLEEVVIKDNPDTKDIDETNKDKVQYLFYIADSTAYKIEIARAVDINGELVLSEYTQPIKLSSTSVNPSDGLLIPEIIGNFMFVYAADKDKNVYLNKIDASITDSNDAKAAVEVLIKE